MGAYSRFKLAIYCTASCLNGSWEQIEKEWAFFQKHLKVSKVYVESHRGDVSLSGERLRELKQFFAKRHIETAGGITPTLGPAYRPGYQRLFGGICYTDEASRAKFREAVETAASVFDEVIFDDFFFTNCGCDSCLQRKGDRSWKEFRLELMTEVSENLIVRPARAVNPHAKMVIKYPNWNESYPSSGYNTATQPWIFDSVYTGTETRDPANSQQHLPRYASFSLMRWMENLLPGKNGGGWFDSIDCTSIDRYLEQANLTVYSGAKELTLFCYKILKDNVYIPALGFQLDKLDELARHLGNPLGLHAYRPHHAQGEDHLYDYLGMLGIPMEPSPYFPQNQGPLLIAADAAQDEEIIAKMEQFLRNGGQVVMTSGFLEKMRGRGAEKFTSLRPTGRKIAIQEFAIDTRDCTFDEFVYAKEPVLYPVLDYSTNSTWPAVVGLNGHNNIPLLTWDNYGKGKIYTLTVPDNYADLWKLPDAVVTKLRSLLTGELLSCRLEGPAQVGFFPCDNDAFVLQSFRSTPEKWRIRLPQGKRLKIVSVESEPLERLLYTAGDGSTVYEIRLRPSSYAAFHVEDARSAAPQEAKEAEPSASSAAT